MCRGPQLLVLILVLGLVAALVAPWFLDQDPGPRRPGSAGGASEEPEVPRSGRAPGTRPTSEPDRREAGTPEESGPEAGPAGTPQGEVSVRTVTEDGRPIASVAVELTSPETSSREAPWARRVTDAEGRASFPGVPPGRWLARTGRHRHQEAFELRDGEGLEIELVLSASRGMDGIVVDARGAPVAGASVWHGPTGHPRETARVAARCGPVAVTAADGSFQLEGFDPGPEWVWLAAHHPSHAPSAWLGFDLGPDDTGSRKRVELRLRDPTHTLRGRVVAGPEGAVVPNARIDLRSIEDRVETLPDWSQLDLSVRASTTSDQDGGFTVTGLVAGAYGLRVLARGHAPAESEVVLVPGVPAPAVTVELEEGVGLVVQVSTERGPAKGIRCLLEASRETTQSRRTDVAGTARFEDLPPGPATLRIDLRGFHPVRDEVQVDADAPSVHRVELRRMPSLRGRLLRPDREAVRNGRVFARAVPDASGRPGRPVGRAVPTGPEGSFELHCPDATPVQLWATAEDLLFPVVLLGGRPVLPDGEDDLECLVEALAPERSAWATATLESVTSPWVTVIRMVAGRGIEQRSGARFQEGFDPDTRRLRVGPLPPGDYRLQIDDTGGASGPFAHALTFTSSTFHLDEGQTADLGILAPPPHGELRWRLRAGRQCRPREPRIEWRALQAEGGSGVGKIDPRPADGVLRGTLPLRTGRYEVTFWGEGFLSETHEIEVRDSEATTLDLTLLAGQRLPLRLSLPENAASATFEVRDPRGVLVHEDSFGTSEAREVVRYPVLPLGRHDVLVQTGDGRWTGTFEVTSLTPTDTPLTFALRRQH